LTGGRIVAVIGRRDSGSRWLDRRGIGSVVCRDNERPQKFCHSTIGRMANVSPNLRDSGVCCKLTDENNNNRSSSLAWRTDWGEKA
jgi:hypothetical protein